MDQYSCMYLSLVYQVSIKVIKNALLIADVPSTCVTLEKSNMKDWWSIIVNETADSLVSLLNLETSYLPLSPAVSVSSIIFHSTTVSHTGKGKNNLH